MNSLPQQATEAAITKVATAAQYGGGGSALVFGLTPSEWSVVGVIGGLLIGAIGYLTNTWFKSQHLALARAQRRADADE